MRFNLIVPFAQKDEAKKLGARWDAGRKIWYVINEGDLASFNRWSPTPHDEAQAPTQSAKSAANTKQAAKQDKSGKIYIGADYRPQASSCDCLPWEDCDVCRIIQ